jgi:hypothetical protein
MKASSPARRLSAERCWVGAGWLVRRTRTGRSFVAGPAKWNPDYGLITAVDYFPAVARAERLQDG